MVSEEDTQNNTCVMLACLQKLKPMLKNSTLSLAEQRPNSWMNGPRQAK